MEVELVVALRRLEDAGRIVQPLVHVLVFAMHHGHGQCGHHHHRPDAKYGAENVYIEEGVWNERKLVQLS